MVGRPGGSAAALTMLMLALPGPVWAGSAQATLSVAVVVSARCAVRIPGSVAPEALQASGTGGGGVAMRCTKGAVPSGRDAGAAAVGPRITRTVLPESAPSPRAETATLAPAETVGPRMIVTVNF